MPGDDKQAFLERYRGADVEVHYLVDSNAYRDRGVVQDFGDGWLELQKPGPELLLIPVSAVRIVKVVGAAEAPAGKLLRPAEPPPAITAREDPKTGRR